MKTYLNLKGEECWKCGAPTTVAWATTKEDDGSDGSYLFPDDFDDALRCAASERGAVIERTLSKTTGEVRDSCVCPACGALFGDRFLFSLVYCEDEAVEMP